MTTSDQTVCQDLGEFIDASPSPYHAVHNAATKLQAAGFVEVAETDAWTEAARSGYFRRGGSLVAWRLGSDAGFRVIGAHTDSPNLRIKPQPDTGGAGFAQLGVEVYGGVLLNSWLDRDLGISGRVAMQGEAGIEERLVLIDRPVLRVAQLAIHLDREVNEQGLKLNKQTHMTPLWREGAASPGAFAEWLAGETGLDREAIRGWDLMTHDLTPSAALGADSEFYAAPRIDNLASCHAAVAAIIDTPSAATTSVICLFDHEEIGSVSASGAAGALLPHALQRIHALTGEAAEQYPRALARSACISADGAHATHPNYAERHEPDHKIALNAGPVIKRNANQRYATDAIGQAIAEDACRRADVPFQIFVNRSDLACGSTIGPVTSAHLGITTVDMGIPQLSMHSARELCGTADPARLRAALAAFLGG